MTTVIFDCDGVLVDSEIISCAANAEALTGIGYKVSIDEVIERFVGLSSKDMYDIIEADMGCALPSDFGAQVKERVLDKYRSDLRAVEGARDVLTWFHGRTCVASSSAPAKLALGLVETALFELLYPNIFATVLVENGKPHPDIFLYAARAMGSEPSDCLVVEDSVAGVTAARAAGMKAVGFVGGSHCRPGHSSRLAEAGAETVIDDLRMLRELA